MSRSPTTPDKRVGHADSRPASGWASYQGKEEAKGSRRGDQPEGSISGTGPNPNMTYASGGGVYSEYAGMSDRRNGDSCGCYQEGADYQRIEPPTPNALLDGYGE